MTSLTITELGGPSGPDFDDFAAVYAAVDGELTPEDPTITAAEIEAEYLRQSERREVRTWVARSGNRAIGALVVEIPHAANDRELRPEAYVLPDARRQGVGSALLSEGLAATSPGRNRVAAWVQNDAAGGLCRGLGMTHRQIERCSRLRITDVEPTQQRQWIDDAPARADGYRVVSWQGPCPDEYVDAFCTALDAMADMPVDDLVHEHAPTRPRDVREKEAVYSDAHEPFASLALGPGGEAAGMTLIWASRNRPGLAYQDDTAVVAAHRGHALGRWLKAANLGQVLAARSQLRTVETYNAESNPWMLEINVDMGFRPFKAFDAYQGPLDDAMRALGATG